MWFLFQEAWDLAGLKYQTQWCIDSSQKGPKFLGVVLDEKLTFIPLIKQLKHNCLKTMTILEVPSHIYYGAGKQLLRIFTS